MKLNFLFTIFFIQFSITMLFCQRLSSEEKFCEIMNCIFSEEVFYNINNKEFFGSDTIVMSLGNDIPIKCNNIIWKNNEGIYKYIKFQVLEQKTSNIIIQKEYREATLKRNHHWILKELSFKGNLILVTLFRPINNLEIFVAYKKEYNAYNFIDSTYGFY